MARALEDGTVSATDRDEGASPPSRHPYLFLVVESHRPLSMPVRVALDRFDEVVFGRGSSRAIEHEHEGGRPPPPGAPR